jgi:hypothetical protein
MTNKNNEIVITTLSDIAYKDYKTIGLIGTSMHCSAGNFYLVLEDLKNELRQIASQDSYKTIDNFHCNAIIDVKIFFENQELCITGMAIYMLGIYSI